MRFKIILASVSAFLIFVVLGTMICPPKLSAQIIQTCSQGVVVFGDGSISIDGWKTFAPSVMPLVDSKELRPNIGNLTEKITDYPSKVEFKKGVKGNTRICFEDENGTHCVALDKLRSVK